MAKSDATVASQTGRDRGRRNPQGSTSRLFRPANTFRDAINIGSVNSTTWVRDGFMAKMPRPMWVSWKDGVEMLSVLKKIQPFKFKISYKVSLWVLEKASFRWTNKFANYVCRWHYLPEHLSHHARHRPVGLFVAPLTVWRPLKHIPANHVALDPNI